MILLRQNRTGGALVTPSPALTTTRKDRAMATSFNTPETTASKGVQGELIASAWLVGLGYDVFRNVGPVGDVDLVAYKKATGELHLIDVKYVNEANVYERPDGSWAVAFGRGASGEKIHKLIVSAGVVLGFCSGFGKHWYWPLDCDPVETAFSVNGRTCKDVIKTRRENGAWQ